MRRTGVIEVYKVNVYHRLFGMNANLKIVVACASIYSTLQIVAFLLKTNEVEDSLQYRLTLPTPRRNIYPAERKLLKACRGGDTYGYTEYAFVSLISSVGGAAMRDLPFNVVSAAKLGVSLKRWTNLDAVMMLVGGRTLPFEQQHTLTHSGWIICYMDNLPDPYSILNVWSMVEYSVVAIVDSNTLVVRDPIPLFTQVYIKMANERLLVAGIRRTTWANEWGQCLPNGSGMFDTGVFVLAPNVGTFEALKGAIITLPHKRDLGGEGLLDAYFRGAISAMPFAFNADVLSLACDPALWIAEHKQLAIIHYTTIKPWEYTLQPSQPSIILDRWPLWLWNVGFLYALWDSAPKSTMLVGGT